MTTAPPPRRKDPADLASDVAAEVEELVREGRPPEARGGPKVACTAGDKENERMPPARRRSTLTSAARRTSQSSGPCAPILPATSAMSMSGASPGTPATGAPSFVRFKSLSGGSLGLEQGLFWNHAQEETGWVRIPGRGDGTEFRDSGAWAAPNRGRPMSAAQHSTYDELSRFHWSTDLSLTPTAARRRRTGRGRAG
ncbi:hypothetical protein THAOC_05621 [Thalassiosira oceanica]|uniref:Uncharacterized protein n=1 Tax=Thalassiosira oceanica TaxID=159749 RepID=K0T6W7_THAOC|nr:hypothetical protein THAOC_05621 [Thalassiosira oceanica]|eukprot:EJK72809.1 hypothetical protein THAOC_05621 [Thalassiosira oceanica]